MMCKYDETGKLIVSNGKTLLIKNKSSNFANTYKTENTYFKYFLNKAVSYTHLRAHET